MNHTCLHCGEKYETDNRHAKFCSRTCTTDARVTQRFSKPVITKAFRNLSAGERLSVRRAADSMKIPHMGDVMALSVVAHLGAWLEENS